MVEQAFPQEGIGNGVFSLVKGWIDPLLDRTMNTPRRITMKMLELRMCIERASKNDELMEGEEVILKETIERAESNADDDEGTSMWTLVRVG